MDIFEQLDKNFDLCCQVRGLNQLVFYDKLCSNYDDKYSFFTVLDSTVFKSWDYNYGCNDIIELLQKLDLFDKEQNSIIYVDNQIAAYKFLQLDINLLYYGFNSRYRISQYGVRFDDALSENADCKIRFILKKANLKVVKNPSKDYFLVVPQNNNVTFVAEKTDKATAFHFFEYTSPIIKHDVQKKRNILKLLANRYEVIIKKYKDKYGKAASIFNDLSAILNSFEIRHSNLDANNGKYYHEKLVNYTDAQWIEIYDTAFQIILCTTLIDDYNSNLIKIIENHKNNL